ncbi:hypothetical protein Tco_1303310 [Tanacetum coccineum]
MNTPSPTTIRSPRILINLVSSDTDKLQELMETDTIPSSSTPSSSSSKLFATNRLLSLFKSKSRCFKRYKSFFDELQGKYGYLFGHLTIREKSQAEVAKMITDAIQQECKNFRSEISSQVNDAITNHIPSQVDSEVRSYMSRHLQQDDLPIWFALKYKFERLHMATTPCRPSNVRPRDQDDPHDDAYPERENSTKRQKTYKHRMFVFGESSSGQDYESESGPSTSGNQDQSDDFDFWKNPYATDDDDVLLNEKVSQELVDEMSQTVDEVKLCKVVNEMKEIMVPPYQPKPTLVVQSCQRDPKAPALSLVNQDLLYLKKGNTGPKKIALSLHNFPAVRFPDNDIKERTSRWIVVRRANGYIVSITESDYKNLNKNDIKDMYLLIINHKVDDYAETGLMWSLSVFIRSTVIWERVHDFQLGVESYQQQVNLTAPRITFLGIEKYKVFSIVSEPLYGIIYKNSKNEKRVMRHQEVHNKEDVEYLQLFAEEIEERLKYRDQMRRWEMYVNGRPLGSRRERPE